VFNMVGLVLLLTVYIMATYTVDQESKRDMGPTARKVDEMMKFYIDLKTALSLLTGVITASILLAWCVRGRGGSGLSSPCSDPISSHFPCVRGTDAQPCEVGDHVRYLGVRAELHPQHWLSDRHVSTRPNHHS
jgi:hypothetical protein